MTLVFGHGPDDGEHAINTLPSFAWVRSLGADGVELDVRRTSDDQLVVIHDPIGDVARRDLPAHVPDLARVLDECRGLRVNVELKSYPRDPDYDAAERVTHLTLELLEDRDDDVVISCFGFGAIDLARGRVDTAMLYLSRQPAAELLDAVVAHGHRIVHPYDTMVDATFMELARERELGVNVWVGEVGEQRLRELVSLGVDGLITAEVEAARSAQMPRR